jgi:hypothetical protein
MNAKVLSWRKDTVVNTTDGGKLGETLHVLNGVVKEVGDIR